MKLFTLWRFILLSALFSLLGIGSAWAQLTELEVGKVYHFTNVNYSDKALAATYPNSVAGVAVDIDNKSQLWYIESKNVNGYLLRNLAFGTYLQGNGQSSRWTLASTTDSNNSWITLKTVGSNYAFKGYTYGDYGYAHIDGSSNVVGWESGATATQWTITEKVMTSPEIEEALNIFNSVPTIQAHLDNLFSDKSCTTLKGAFDENDASFKALPTTLQAMVRKVAGNTSWEEANSDNSKAKWDAEYAKKYRVQLYEPYNEPECAAKALRINAHTNLNNPTGIFAKKDDILYVMVEGVIKEGSKLYLSYYKGHDRLAGATDGYELKQGLNVIPVYYDESNFCVNYVVNTFDTSKGYGSQAKAHPLSDYAPIKIHIEGGYINGYWNKMGDALYTADTDEDWNYIEARATQQDVVVLGKYMTLKFPLLSVHAENQTAMSQIYNEKIKVSESINEWDNIMLWERFVMGLSTKADLDNSTLVSPYSDKKIFEYTGEDYTDYYNVHGLAYSIESSKNPHAGWDYTGYPNNSMVNINADIFTNAGAHWTAGHEIGHQHQGPLNMRGLTEVTNNLFSNVVLWCFGKSTSRYNGTDGSLTNILQQFNAEGTDFFSNNIWAQTIMYYKLFLYYHVLGHNTQFYPRLYEMLRQNPMIIEGDQDGSKCLMHFYKLCCEAAGEDLTEFFRAHGFFEVMNSRFVGDYSSATYNLTQAQIDQAIAEVKTKGYPVNLAVLFINDATGEEIQSHKGGVLELYGETRVCSEIGSYSNFNSDAANYTYGVAGNLVTMEGEGGVGFAILNEKGELIGFSDKKTFELSAEAAAAIASGKASIVSIKGDNTPVVATNVMDSDNIGTKYELLGELLDNSKFILTRADATGTKVGFYRESALDGLQRAYDKAKEVYDAKTVAAYSSVYDVLFQEYVNIMSNEYARINITEGYAYRLTNKAYPGLSMAVNTGNHQMFGIETDESDAQLWYFEPGTSLNTYYLKNKSTQQYPGDVSTGAVLSANKSEAEKGKDNGAYAYNLQSMGNGIFALVGSTGLHCSSSQSYNIVGWGADDDATQWYITAVALDDALEARTKLEELIGKTEALVNEMAEVKIKGSALDLTTCTITSNTPETGHETKYLVDGNPTTFFHTNWTGATISENHNFIIDLGEGNSLEQFAFNYITLPSTQNNVDAPKTMVIEGSTNGTDYTSITSLSELPTTKGTTYASTTLGTKGTAYRYLRFSVTDATGGKLGNYYYFGIAEFGLTNMQTELLSVKDGYSSSQTAILDACDGLYAANLVYNNETATQEKLQEAASALNEDYTALLNAYNAVKEAGLEAKKEKLQELIDNTTALIGQCGDVTYTPATFHGEAPLQTANSTGKFYVSTNADQNTGGGRVDGGGIAALVDNNYNTYFHTRWEGTKVYEPHYFQVDLGEDIVTNKFTFTYKPRQNSPAPTSMIVYGSTDGSSFTTVLANITSGLPVHDSGESYQSTVIESPELYRYLRFTVTGSLGPGEKVFNDQYFFGLLEFDLNLIGSPESYKVVVDEGMGEVNEALMLATYHEVAEAQSTITYATTEAQLDKAIANLQAQYDALHTAKNNVVKSELLSAIEAAQDAIELCCSSITQENGDYIVTWNFETAGDVDKATLIAAYEAVVNANSVYESASSTVDDYQTALTTLSAPISTLNEYMEGEHKPQLRYMVGVITAFITDCQESLGDLTNGMFEDIVQRRDAANDYLTQEFATREELVNTIAPAISYFEQNYPSWLTAQQSSAKAELRSLIAQLTELIEQCGVVEFVPATEGNEAHYVATLDPYAGVVTAEQLIAAYVENVEAEELANNSAVAAELTDKKDALQDVYNNLLTAKDTNWLPVTLTKDINSPVLYTFKSARSSDTEVKVMQYDPAESHSFSIATATDGAVKQAFFFMMGDTRNQVYIYPYAGAGMVLGADNTDNGANKVFAGEKGTQAYEQWTFVKRTVEDVIWYDLKPVGEETYFSNFGGGSNKMGFYNSSDEGSRFQFDEVEVEIEGSAAYNSLKVYHEDLAKVKGSTLVGSTEVGYYPEDQATVYNTAYAAATETLADANATDDDYLAEYASLRSANEAMAMNMPEDGSYYIIQSVVKDNGTALVYANPTDNKMYWSNSKTATTPEALWMFEDNGDGTYTVSNMHTGTMMNGFINYNPTPLNPETGSVTLHSLASNGQIGIKTGNTMMHAQSGGAIVHWDTGANDGSAWRIIKADETAITYPLNITQYGYAGLHLNYPVELPNELTAYTIYLAEGANGIARLKPINGSVVPANTGVIIEGKQGDYNLNYTTNEGNKIDNLLLGSNYTRYVKADNNTDYFVFAAKKQADDSYKVGLYITWEQYDANGSTDVKDSEGQVVGSNKNTHQGGYFKSSANKIYLPYSNEAGAAKFFFQRDYDITGIDSLLNGLNSCDEVYDLQGRRISKVTKEGIYIVNGQKRYLKATKF